MYYLVSESRFIILIQKLADLFRKLIAHNHGLRTPNEGKNQRILKIWADVADKIPYSREH